MYGFGAECRSSGNVVYVKVCTEGHSKEAALSLAEACELRAQLHFEITRIKCGGKA